MTLQNLKEALYQNNIILLQKINNTSNEGELALLREQNALLLEEINQLSEILDDINRTVIT